MGQIIDFNQHRRRVREETSAAASSPSRPMATGIYLDGMLLPGLALWRSLMVSCAALWLAPFGIEVKPVEARETAPEKERASRGG